MSSTATRSPKPERRSLFLRDLASPVPNHRGVAPRFATPGQAAAVSALRRENFASSSPPPPPILSLDDRPDFSPEPVLGHSPEARTPPPPSSGQNYLFSSPSPLKTKPGSSDFGGAVPNASPGSASWWSPAKSGSGGFGRDERGKGSPVEGVVQPGALVVLPPPREVARPEIQRNCWPMGELDEEEWVTVYGFSLGDTNLVLREFEKCGVILRYIPGPRDANWMHILYQSRYDAQKALAKHGQQLNSILIIGVKAVDPRQRQYLNESLSENYHAGSALSFSLQPMANGKSAAARGILGALAHPNYLQTARAAANQNGQATSGPIASPTKSVLSKVMDLMFGI